MKPSWPNNLGKPFVAWTWYEDSILDDRDTSFQLDAATVVITELLDMLSKDKVAIRRVLNELGIPGEGYPAPVANAVEILTWLLED